MSKKVWSGAVGILVVALVLVAVSYAFKANAPTTNEKLSEATPTPTPVSTSVGIYGEQADQTVLPTSPTTAPVDPLSPTDVPQVSPQPGQGGAVQQMVVSITDTGFTPPAITVPLDTVVSFVNNGQAIHKIVPDAASAAQLTGFDSTKGLATGEVYEYTFKKLGTWIFRDDLQPSNTIEVIIK